MVDGYGFPNEVQVGVRRPKSLYRRLVVVPVTIQAIRFAGCPCFLFPRRTIRTFDYTFLGHR